MSISNCESGSKIVSKSITTTSDPLDNNDISIYDNPIVQEMLRMLPKSEYNSSIEISFPITKKFIDEDRKIIAGYASVEVIDKQNELIPIEVIKEAWVNFKKNKDFYFGSLMHSNIPIIKILDEYKDKDGQIWKSEVDDNGLFIVAEVRQDITKGVQTWELIEKGKLTGFSIGGEALGKPVKVCEGNKCYDRVDKMELHEIAVVDRPANTPSIFKIVKRDNSLSKEDVTIPKPKGKVLHIPRKMLEGIDTIKIDVVPNQVVDITTQNVSDGIVLDVTKSLAKLDKAYTLINKRMLGKPFAGYKDFDACVLANKDKGDPEAYCASIMRQVEGKAYGVPKTVKERLMSHFNLSEEQATKLIDNLGEKEADKLLPQRGTGLGLEKQDGRPPKDKWDTCISRASGIDSINNPEAFCGDLYYNNRARFDTFSKGEEIDTKLKRDYLACSVDKVIKEGTWSRMDKALRLLKGVSR